MVCQDFSIEAQGRSAGASFLLSIVPLIGCWCNGCLYPALISLLRRCTTKAPKIGMDVHIPGSKKGRIAALEKLGAPEDAVNGRITAQLSEEKVCRPPSIAVAGTAERSMGSLEPPDPCCHTGQAQPGTALALDTARPPS